MSELQLTVTDEERRCLADVLKRVLKEERIEEHRTRSPSYRQGVIREETLVANLLKKLGEPAE
jgi:hypothetical protein